MGNSSGNVIQKIKSIDWLRALPIIVTVVVFGGLILGYVFVPRIQEFARESWNVLTSEDRERIETWVSQFGALGVVVLILFFLVQMFAFVLPSWLLIIVSVLAYGAVLGGVIALAGILLAASVAYGIGRLFSEVTVQKLVGAKSERKMRGYLDRYGFWLVVIFRIAPFLSNDIISFVAGLATMHYVRFILATALGITPLIALISFLGETNERLQTGFGIVSIVSLIGFGIYVWWDRRQQRTSNA